MLQCTLTLQPTHTAHALPMCSAGAGNTPQLLRDEGAAHAPVYSYSTAHAQLLRDEGAAHAPVYMYSYSTADHADVPAPQTLFQLGPGYIDPGYIATLNGVNPAAPIAAEPGHDPGYIDPGYIEVI